MTTPGFRLLGDGRRRRLGDGRVRSVGAPVDRYADIGGSTTLGVASGGWTTALVPLDGQTILAWELSAVLDSAGVIGHATLAIGTSGTLGAVANIAGAASLVIAPVGLLSAAAPIAGTSLLSIVAQGTATSGAALAGLLQLALATAGDLSAATVIRGAADVGISVTGTLSTAASGRWRDVWLDVYEQRQEVLNGIDANNRYLAKEAGDKAEAAADAVVLTNTRVDDVEDGIEAESLRITALTTRVGNAEGTIGTQGSALSALQTTSSNHAGTLSTHTSQISGLSASITDINGNVTNIANATSVLQTEVNSLGAAKALWGVYLDVNGHISGVQSINDGIVSEFNVAATVFRLLSPAGADGMEIRDGYIRIWKGSSQTIMGNNFGQADQKLMRWFGPNIGAAACNKANATIWEDADGNAYFGGQVLQGVLRYFNSSTTVAFNTEVSTGNVASNSKPVAVTGQVQYARNQFYPGPGAAITLTTGSTSITAVIERRYGTGAWTELARATIPGADAVNNSGADASLAQYASGSLFATDVASSLNREYRTRVITRSVRQHTVTNPGSPVPAAVESQYQSIETME